MNTLKVPTKNSKRSQFVEKFTSYIECIDENSTVCSSFDTNEENQFANDDQLIEIEKEYNSNSYFKTKLDLYINKYYDPKLLEDEEELKANKVTTLKESAMNVSLSKCINLKKVINHLKKTS